MDPISPPTNPPIASFPASTKLGACPRANNTANAHVFIVIFMRTPLLDTSDENRATTTCHFSRFDTYGPPRQRHFARRARRELEPSDRRGALVVNGVRVESLDGPALDLGIGVSTGGATDNVDVSTLLRTKQCHAREDQLGVRLCRYNEHCRWQRSFHLTRQASGRLRIAPCGLIVRPPPSFTRMA